MKRNVGSTDKYIRIILAVALVVGGIFTVSSLLWLSIIFFVFAAIFTMTAITGRCLLYIPFGINTWHKDE